MKKLLEQIQGRRVEPILEAQAQPIMAIAVIERAAAAVEPILKAQVQAQSVMPIAVIERVDVPAAAAAAVFAAAAAVAEPPIIVEKAIHFEKLPKKLLGGMY